MLHTASSATVIGIPISDDLSLTSSPTPTAAVVICDVSGTQTAHSTPAEQTHHRITQSDLGMPLRPITQTLRKHQESGIKSCSRAGASPFSAALPTHAHTRFVHEIKCTTSAEHNHEALS